MTEHRPMAVGGSDPDPWTQTVTLQTYTLELIGPQERAPDHLSEEQILETEENLTDLLPDGYSVRIVEWDEEEKPA